MLAAAKRGRQADTAQRQHDWAGDLVSDELYGRTLLVVGGAGMGQQIIDRAAAFGMRIWATNRRGRSVANAERTVTGDGRSATCWAAPISWWSRCRRPMRPAA